MKQSRLSFANTTHSILTLVVTTLMVLVAGCSEDNGKPPFDTYMQRLANVLEVEVHEPQEYISFSLPSTRDLYVEPSSLTIGLLDSYELRSCGLLELISERNSILGKVSDPFRLYDYQVDFIKTGVQCLEQETLEEGIREVLVEAVGMKQKELNAVFLSNLVWTSDAMKAQWRGYEWLSEADFHHSSQVADALEALNLAFSLAQEKDWNDIPSLTQYQEVLEKQGGVGKLIFSLESVTFELAQLNDFIREHFPSVKCGVGRDKTQYTYLNNVMNQQYIEAIQPKLAKLNQLYYQFESSAEMFDSDTLNYQVSLKAYHSAFHKQILVHVDHWKQLSERCR